MTLPVFSELRSICSKGFVDLGDIDRLLTLDWTSVQDRISDTASAEMNVILQFLKGMRHEYDEGYWDGTGDSDMADRICRFLEITDR